MPFPSPEDLSDPGIEPRSSALQADTLPSEPPGKPILVVRYNKCFLFTLFILFLLIYFISLHPNALEDIYGSLLEKAMAPHSSTLAWKIPWVEEPDRLWSMGSLRVGHD